MGSAHDPPRQLGHLKLRAEINLERLLHPDTVSETLQELQQQLGGLSANKMLQLLSIWDRYGRLASVDEGIFRHWINKGNIPLNYAI